MLSCIKGYVLSVPSIDLKSVKPLSNAQDGCRRQACKRKKPRRFTPTGLWFWIKKLS
jgi:hypothetical protein